MNLPNIPFELIFIVLFFVLPALSNLFGKRKAPPPETPPRTGRRSAPNAERPGAPTVSTTKAGPTTSADTSGADDALRRRLEEARRRVQEAQSQDPGRRGAPTRRPTQGTPARPLVSSSPAPTTGTPRTPQRAPQRTPAPQPTPRQRPPTRAASAPPTSAPPRPRASPPRPTQLGGLDTTLDDAPPLRVQRLGGKERATISWRAERGLFADREAIMQGFIWHQVLSPPRAKQPVRYPRRTRTSRP